MTDVLAAVEESFRAKGRGEVQLPAKIGVDAGGGAFAHAMPAFVPAAGALGVKWVGAFPGQPGAGLPTVSGLIVLADPATGLPVAVMDAGLVTALRTGASAGVAARFLARPGAEVAAIVGCGVQGRSSLRALAAALPGLREVRCRDVSEVAAQRIVEELGALLPDLESAPLRVCARGGPGRRRRGDGDPHGRRAGRRSTRGCSPAGRSPSPSTTTPPGPPPRWPSATA